MSHGIPRTSGPKPVSEQARKKELRKIKEYRELVDEVNNDELTGEVLQKTSKLLQINPEYYTIWNHRRLILRRLFSSTVSDEQSAETDKTHPQDTKGIEELISSDLDFLLPLLRQYPKCYWIWNYRSWLLNEATRLLPTSASHRLWTQELALDSNMLSLDSRNFHGWGYRRTIVEAVELKDPQEGEKDESMTEAEFKYTTKMVETNLSNFSAWHYRSKLIPRLLEERQVDDEARLKLLDGEMAMIERGLYTDPNDQSLWFYYQNLLCTFDPAYTPKSLAPDISKEQQLKRVSEEIESLVYMLDGAEDCKWIYQFLLQLCAMHKDLAEDWPHQREHMSSWMTELENLDPLRAGRWNDLRAKLDL